MSTIRTCDLCSNITKDVRESVASTRVYMFKTPGVPMDLCGLCENKIAAYADKLAWEADKKTNEIIDEGKN